MELNVDVDSLTVGELVDIADVAGESAMDGLAQGKVGPKALLGLLWVLHRRDDPAYTLDQARTVRVTDIKINTPGAPNGNGASNDQGK